MSKCNKSLIFGGAFYTLAVVALTYNLTKIGTMETTGLDGRIQKCVIEQEEDHEAFDEKYSADGDSDAEDVWEVPEAGGEEPPMHDN